MNPLFALLAQQGTGGIVATPEQEAESEAMRRAFPTAPATADDYQGQINVLGRTAPPAPEQEYDPYFGNRKDLEARDIADQEIRDYRQANPRTGMFGVKGTLRDVLGILGDAFLVQSGNAPLYYPTRQKEDLQDRMVGFANNPIAAAERVGGQMGMDLLEAEQNRQLKLAQQQSLEETRNSQIETRDYNRLRDARLLAQGILAQPGAYAPDGSLSPDAQGILTTVARQAGVTVQDLVGENLSPQALRLLGEAGMTVNQQRMLPIQQQRADASTSQAQSAAVRVARPPQGRAPRAESDREAAIRIGNKPEGERTPGERAFYEKYTRPPSSGRTTRTLRADPLGTAAPARRFGPPRN